MREEIDEDVPAFFQAYEHWYARRWPVDSGDDEEYVEQAARYRLGPRRSDVRSDLDRLFRIAGERAAVPASYVVFLEQHEFVDLDLPWVRFPTNQRGRLFDELDERYAAYAPQGLIPFAEDEDGYGSLLFDCRNPTADPTILIWNRGFPEPLVGPVFSSFSNLLRVLARVLRHPDSTNIHVDGLPSSAQVAFLNELRGVDPAGFGGPGWAGWWKGKILGVSGPDI